MTARAAPATATSAPSSPPRTSRFGYASHLSCRECGQAYELGATHVCAECFGPLEVAYDFPELTRASIEAGPQSIWRYASLLPVPPDVAAGPNTEPGWTRLVRADQLARATGMRSLWVKDERGNPTHSFKDRVVAVALAAAIELGFKVLACPSTGNLANAVAAAAARAGIRSVVLIPADLEQQKILGSAIYGGTLVAVRGSYDDVNKLASELADEREDWAFVNVNVRPYYAEGSKTIGFEIAEQLGWRLPEQIVVPVASGAQLVKIDKAFRELAALGLVPDTGWKVFGAQAAGCAPVATAFAAGQDVVQPVRPSTIAKSLAIGNPADGPYVLDVVRRTGGAVGEVSDDELVDAIRLLAATEGIFAETAGGVTLAVLRKLLAEGRLDPDAETVIINSGDGLKTLDAIAPTIGDLTPIRPSLADFAALEASGGATPAPVSAAGNSTTREAGQA
ncbi:MAG TPA: threonine synthase [Streptosporangiaceae bacterium]|nr:threonine synthase [Streptosporangiaceae bacterium]